MNVAHLITRVPIMEQKTEKYNQAQTHMTENNKNSF